MAVASPAQDMPASDPAGARFLVGRDCHGVWVVHDQQGRVGGLFANEAAALHFAGGECNHNSCDICRVPDGALPDLDAEFSTLQRGRPQAAIRKNRPRQKTLP